MPANHKVSVVWQIVLTFIRIAIFWAFQRIRKLRRYLLYVFVPQVLALIVGYPRGLYLDESLKPNFFDPSGPPYQPIEYHLPPEAFVIGALTFWGLQGFAIYSVIIWSRQHNRTFDTPT